GGDRAPRGEVLREDRRGQAELDRVRPPERLVEIRDAVEGGHGPEHLLAREVCVVAYALEDGRRNHEAVLVSAAAAGDHRAALRAAALDRGEDVAELRLVDDRPDLGLGIRRIADLAAGDAVEEPAAEVVVDRVLDVDSPRRRALLAGRPEGAGVGGFDGGVELRVRE